MDSKVVKAVKEIKNRENSITGENKKVIKKKRGRKPKKN